MTGPSWRDVGWGFPRVPWRSIGFGIITAAAVIVVALCFAGLAGAIVIAASKGLG